VLHRYGSVCVDLARRLLTLREGDRLAPIAQLAAEFGTGRGTIQSALRLLVEAGAVRLESRGFLGSFVAGLDRVRLLEQANLPAVIGVMPVAYSLRFQGLATGLMRACEQAHLPLVLAQVRGGRNRVEFLRSGRCDFAIVSRLAWEAEAARGDLQLLFGFGPGSSVGDHVWLLAPAASGGLCDGLRVGVDPASHDHMRLTLAECQGKAVRLVTISYAQAVPKLLAGEIDAALWDAGAPLSLLGLTTRPLAGGRPDAGADTEAVLLVRAGSDGVAGILERSIRCEVVTAVQQRVLAGEETPDF